MTAALKSTMASTEKSTKPNTNLTSNKDDRNFNSLETMPTCSNKSVRIRDEATTIIKNSNNNNSNETIKKE